MSVKLFPYLMLSSLSLNAVPLQAAAIHVDNDRVDKKYPVIKREKRVIYVRNRGLMTFEVGERQERERELEIEALRQGRRAICALKHQLDPDLTEEQLNAFAREILAPNTSALRFVTRFVESDPREMNIHKGIKTFVAELMEFKEKGVDVERPVSFKDSPIDMAYDQALNLALNTR